MPLVNSLLVEWGGGWAEVKDDASIAAHGRHEALLGLGHVTSETEMRRVAGEQLRVFADPRTEVGTDFAPATTAQWPYVAFRPGDRVRVPDVDGAPLDEVVKAVTASQDDNGVLTFSLDVKDVVLEEQERFAQALKKMADGTVSGSSAVASPVTYSPPAQPVALTAPVQGAAGAAPLAYCLWLGLGGAAGAYDIASAPDVRFAANDDASGHFTLANSGGTVVQVVPAGVYRVSWGAKRFMSEALSAEFFGCVSVTGRDDQRAAQAFGAPLSSDTLRSAAGGTEVVWADAGSGLVLHLSAPNPGGYENAWFAVEYLGAGSAWRMGAPR